MESLQQARPVQNHTENPLWQTLSDHQDFQEFHENLVQHEKQNLEAEKEIIDEQALNKYNIKTAIYAHNLIMPS